MSPPESAAASRKKTKCYTQDLADISAGCYTTKENRTFAWFEPDGDSIGILDHYRNGHSTKVLLKVDGYKKRTYSSKGKSYRTIDENFKENREVKIKVCTSFSKKAKCSAWSESDLT
ncbi:hypothetical protein [Streptomyces cavernicola]|uniref:Uncharacterized protein n=1 Tax=Streptomyces cavernicola TaxID=3043613 RepID=A0ABT6S7Y3_9ACTN|nr:hypothetical protein [Streptomyces sp. B-S-A6]MDI3404185.1 hypothetical protein [Streptomyces sp. B-S-A6]